MKVSAVLIAYNEEERLPATLKALSWCDEIILVDSGSQDRTLEIAKSFGAKVFSHPFQGFGPQKNYAIAQAKNEWVLSVDADEVVTPELAEEIQKVSSSFSGYQMEILNIFMGRPMRLMGKATNKLRLFQKSKGQFLPVEVHEEVQVQGSVGKLKNQIYHYSYKNLHHYFEKFNEYTNRGSRQVNSKPIGLVQLLFRFPLKFFALYFFRGGFRAGIPGFAWCLLSSLYPTVKYLKHYEQHLMQEKK